MGFGTIIAALVSVAAILFASYACAQGGIYMADTLSESVKEMQDSKNEILKTELEITGIQANGTEINVDIRNAGHAKIREFSKMDVILQYCNSSSTKKITWVPYQAGPIPTENKWVLTEISPDVINPGILDPGELMKIQIRLEDSEPLMHGSVNWLQITAPNGVGDSRAFQDTAL